jgi:hypothetical protein
MRQGVVERRGHSLVQASCCRASTVRACRCPKLPGPARVPARGPLVQGRRRRPVANSRGRGRQRR